MNEQAVSSIEQVDRVPIADSGLDSASGRATALAGAARPAKRRTIFGAIRRQRLALTGLCLIGLFVAMAIFGPMLAPFGPDEQFSQERLKPPSRTHLFGTDEFGRDVLSRLLYGARISLRVGLIAVGIAGSLGILFGMASGYFRGWIDNIITLAMDIVFAFPAVLLAITIITVFGNSLTNAMIAIAIVYTPPFVRIVRGAVLSVRNTAYVEAARSVGGSTPRILARHVFPNITAPLIVQTSLSFGFAILSEAALAYLGLGNKQPSPSWGSMMSSSYGFLQLAPWAAIFPGIAIALTVLGFNLLGDGLRDALDPRLRN